MLQNNLYFITDVNRSSKSLGGMYCSPTGLATMGIGVFSVGSIKKLWTMWAIAALLSCKAKRIPGEK